ncbi:unnamed protein product [Caenorhabditis sp. 36 PRJEB53466]|nr:unnamed protein product [Caenorhabditis sp. 36 PRJEB53466]
MRLITRLSIFLLLAASSTSHYFGGICDNSTCGEHGRCEDGPISDSYWCSCDEGFGGDFCEKRCPLKCGEHDKCMLDQDNTFSCQCQGSHCPGYINVTSKACEENSCNNGRCVAFNGGFLCVCNSGYSGSFCEKGYNHCQEHKCYPRSECINQKQGYFCSCPPGRSGRYCDMPNCQMMLGICNKGKCISNSESDKRFDCICDEGYTGEYCNKDKNECLGEKMCLNDGKCINLLGSYYCDCPPGYTGKWCGNTVDMCAFHKCENNGTCIHTEKQEPVCQCKDGFIGKRCEKQCPPGYTGRRCELRLDERTCSRTKGRCHNGGKCIQGFCTCPPDYTGTHCEIHKSDVVRERSNTCASDPCMNNATCVDVDAEIGYACLCPEGFEGDICERQKDWCKEQENACANGGHCQRKGDSFICTCPAGFEGERCEQLEKFTCNSNPCANEGVCVHVGRSAKCECPFGFAGPKCQERVDLPDSKERMLRTICDQRNCSSLAGNGICNPECNQEVCNFDGGDCSGGQQPFHRCQYAAKCSDAFADGVCNQECNSEECLYDGLDCLSAVSRCPAKIRNFCAQRFANGVCDVECNSEGCGYDGGDCVNRTQMTILTDIRIKIQMDPMVFKESGGQTLIDISSALRATVRIQRDEKGPLVFEWDGEKELERLEMDIERLAEQNVLSTRVRKTRSTNYQLIRGIVLYMEMEEICQVTDCRFTSAQSVVDLIAAGLTKTDGRSSFGLPITEAMVASPKKSSGSSGWSRNQILLVAVIAFLAFGTVAAGVVAKTGDNERSRKRKMIHAQVWMLPKGNVAGVDDPKIQSIRSSQCSLLTNNEPFHAKRHCGEYDMPYGGNHQQFYPQQLREEYTSLNPTSVSAKKIDLHVQASGCGPITIPLTKESVNQVDATFKRHVLHWLAANKNNMPEDMITSESKRCIEAGADVNALDSEENTPLMLAVRARRVRLAVMLMKAGADPTIFNKAQRSALHEAVSFQDHRMVMILLLDKRMLKEIDELDQNGMTALMQVARKHGDDQVKMAQLLIKKGAKIDADGTARKNTELYRGRTALHYAASVNNVPMVEFLVANDANKDKPDEDGQTPLMLAAREGHEHTVQFLVEAGASISTTDKSEKTAAALAASRYHHDIAKYLVVAQRNQRDNFVRQQTARGEGARKPGRQNMKTVKRAALKKESTVAAILSPGQSTRLTPPPSDGSFSSPSPHFVQTMTSTPTAVESSPDHGYQSEMPATTSNWYVDPSAYTEGIYQQMPNYPAYYYPQQ